MPTTYGNDIVYCLKSHCGVRGYCRQKWVLQVQIICKFSNERTCKRNKDVQGLSCGFEVNESVYARTHNKYAYKGPSPPSGSDFFRIHVFPFIVIQKDKQRLAVHWTWKNKPFSLFIQKS